MLNEVIFDVETKSFFDETGRKDPEELGVSLISVYKRHLDNNLKEITGQMFSFWEDEIEKSWEIFLEANRVIGFNSLKFDIPALKPYTPSHFPKLPHFDIISEIKKVYGRRVSLNALAKETLGLAKIDSGANAVAYWQKHDPESLNKLRRYCEDDVKLTKEIYDYALKNKQLKFKDHWNTLRVIDVDFSYPKNPTLKKQASLF